MYNNSSKLFWKNTKNSVEVPLYNKGGFPLVRLATGTGMGK